jgi:hypothetical protein
MLRNLLIRCGMASCKRGLPITLSPWHCHPGGGLPVSEHRQRKGKVGTFRTRFERRSDETTTLSCAQFRVYALAFGAWIASFQDVSPRHEDRPQPNCTP